MAPMMNRMRLFLPLGLLAASFTLPASAGVIYQMETKASDDATPVMVTFRAQDNRLKMDYEGEDSEWDFVIYNGEDQTLTVASSEERAYYVLDKAQLSSVTDALSAAQRQMEQALAQVPESQRERMREMMQGGMAGLFGETAKVPEVAVERTGENRTIEGYETTQYIIRVDGRRASELWVTPWDRIEGSDDVRESLHSMANFFSEMLEAIPQMAGSDDAQSNWLRGIEQIDGFPVKSHVFEGGSDVATETTTLKSVRTADLSEEDLSPPEGYTRRTIDMPRF